MRKDAVWYIAHSLMWTGTNIMVALTTFAVYSASGNELKPNIAFTALALFNILRIPMSALPHTISMAIDCRTSMRRLYAFLCAQEVDKDYYANDRTLDEPQHENDQKNSHNRGESMDATPSTVPSIRIRNGRFSWPLPRVAVPGGSPEGEGQETQILYDVDFEVLRGELVMVCGAVGAGKSSLVRSCAYVVYVRVYVVTIDVCVCVNELVGVRESLFGVMMCVCK
jgi:ATP-binding cassette subfamily C (CFTR/MRP) protein 1